MTDLVDEDAPILYKLAAKYQYQLGWKNFIEGGSVTPFVQIQHNHPRDSESWSIAELQATGLTDQLLRLTHRQWLHRNVKVHFRRSDGRTIAQFVDIMRKVKDLIWTDPDNLLLEDRCLLKTNFDKLGKASAMEQEH